MSDPHCIAWIKATARVTCIDGNQVVFASEPQDVRLRFNGDTIDLDRDLSMPITRTGWDGRIEIRIRDQLLLTVPLDESNVIRYHNNVNLTRPKC